MKRMKSAMSLLCFAVAAAMGVYGQAPASSSKREPDVLVLKDGEKLIGQLQSATGSSVVFKSDALGELTVDWSKVGQLHSSKNFAAIPKGLPLRNKAEAAGVSHGTVSVTDQQLQVQGPKGTPQSVPVGGIANLVPEASYERAFERSSFFHGWQGGMTAGVSLTEATQKNQTFTAAVNMVRSVPEENWLSLRRRTTFDYAQAYGKLTQPNTPEIKTSLYHIGLEQDWYLSPRLFAFGQAILDHNFSQGLQLQQTYGGGLGLVVIKGVNQELDFKASADYVDQRFDVSGRNQHLFGSIFGETYTRKFIRGILLNQQAGITPAWTNTDAYSAFASAALTFPVYRHFGLTLGALDTFLNNPPPDFKKNSFQFTLGATYSLQ